MHCGWPAPPRGAQIRMPNPPTPNAASRPAPPPGLQARVLPARRQRAPLRVLFNRAVLVAVPWTAIVLVWYAIAYSGLINPGLVPKPHDVAVRFWELLTAGRLLSDMWMSTQRVFLGVASGIVLAVPVGFVLGWYREIRRFIDPVINFFRALPPIALIPLVIVYFGIGESAKIAILFYASFFAGVIVMYEGVAQISPIFIRVARTLGATDGEVFRKVVLPLAVPHILTALRVALGVAWATLVASELIAAQQGLGALIQNASVVLPARHHLRRHHLHRPDRARHGPDAARRQPAPGGMAGPDRVTTQDDRCLARAHQLRPRFGGVRLVPRAAAGGRRRVVQRRGRRVRVDHRPVGLRQDDDDEHRRRLRAARQRRRAARRQADRRPRPGARRDLPGVRRSSRGSTSRTTSPSA